MGSSSPNHVVLGVKLGRSVGIEPSLGDEGIGLGVDLLVVKRRPGGRDEHRSLGDDVVVGSEREVLEGHVGNLRRGRRGKESKRETREDATKGGREGDLKGRDRCNYLP